MIADKYSLNILTWRSEIHFADARY